EYIQSTILSEIEETNIFTISQSNSEYVLNGKVNSFICKYNSGPLAYVGNSVFLGGAILNLVNAFTYTVSLTGSFVMLCGATLMLVSKSKVTATVNFDYSLSKNNEIIYEGFANGNVIGQT
nr:hypothetical protein [Prolixibacteraceae bacterium]